MKISKVKVCVLRIEGTNCEEESYLAFKRLGAKPEKVHLKQLTGAMCGDTLDQAQAIALDAKAQTQTALRKALKDYRKNRH
jgi:phosphoribosylformylglycinamidine (FGAM) synthase-like amidotransferase family enzyme